MPLSKADLYDADIYDAPELNTDSTVVYLTTAVTSTVATNTVNVVLPADGEGLLTSRDHPLQVGDKADITGTSGGLGDGTYTVATVVTDLQFTTVEPIVASTGGSINFRYPSGATNIGVNPAGFVHTSANILQTVLADLDTAVVTSAEHAALKQLIHLADGGGPFEGFASGAYRETLPSANPFPTSIIWYTDATKTKKIVAKLITFDGQKRVTAIQWSAYASDGTTVIAQVTDAISYSSVFEINRTRTVV